MFRIIHLSDLHFGTEKPELIAPLISDIQQLQPDIITVSGDLTQRAKSHEFAAARNLLNSLENKTLSVPGNHDITLYNPIRRFFQTYDRYKTYISTTLNPQFMQNHIAILGINSATPYRAKGGLLIPEQIDYINTFFQKQAAHKIKILIMHHNLLRSDRHKIMENSEKIINILAQCKVNLVLGGHLHYPVVERITRKHFHHSLYAITAGTAISDRIWKNEKNSYNVIDISKNQFTMIVRAANHKNEFVKLSEQTFPLVNE